MGEPIESSRGCSLREALERLGGITFRDGNTVRRLRNGAEIFPAMFEAVSAAQYRIDFVTFVYWTGDVAVEMANRLTERANAGVEVNVLLDAVGARLMDDDLVDQLRDGGATVRWFRPMSRWKFWETDHRTHRKILVVDHEVAFTGGVGIADEWDGNAANPDEWRDSHFEIRGPAVDELRATFLADWRDAYGHIGRSTRIPEATGSSGDVSLAVVDAGAQIELDRAGRILELLVDFADHRIWISTPYFNPLPELCDRLAAAARRGVDVRIMTPGEHIDKRISKEIAEAHATELLEAGVTILEYQRSMLHLKQLIVDDDIAMFGSVNVNARSVFKDEEVAVIAHNEPLVALLADDFLADAELATVLEEARAANPEHWWRRIVGAVLAPFRNEF